MSKRILCVDDEPRVLLALERQHGARFELTAAVGSQQGLIALKEKGPFAVVISDLRMPGVDGIRFLSLVRRQSPDSVRIMLTGQGDLKSVMEAVNEAKVFQFLIKPCPSERFTQTVEAALEQHRLIVAERELQEKTLHGMVGLLSEILGLVSPAAFGRAHRIRRYVQQMAAHLELPDAWQYELAAMLCQVGYVSLPSDTLDRLQAGQLLSNAERETVQEQARVGYDLLARIPRLDKVANMVLGQDSMWSGDRSIDDPEKIGAHMLRVALDFDELLVQGKDAAQAIEEMQRQQNYHPALKAALQEIRVVETNRRSRHVRIAQLQPGMRTGAAVYGRNGLLLLGKGQEMAESAIARLKGFALTIGVIEPISVVETAGPAVTPGGAGPASWKVTSASRNDESRPPASAPVL